MLTNTINSMEREKASFLRDLEYIRECCSEEYSDDRLLKLESEVCGNNDIMSKAEFDSIDENLPSTDEDKEVELDRSFHQR